MEDFGFLRVSLEQKCETPHRGAVGYVNFSRPTHTFATDWVCGVCDRKHTVIISPEKFEAKLAKEMETM